MGGALRHTYEYEVELGADTAPARVIRMIGRDRRVLEVGAGPGSITKHLVRTSNCDVVALEIDPTAIAKLKEFCANIHSLDLNDPEWTQALAREAKFDVVLAADVLEHVGDPVRTLKGMVSLLKDNGEIVLSLPHVGHCVINACLLDEDFDYREWGLLDKTHIRFFGLKNINKLYADAGLAIVEAEFVVRTPEQTEFAERWRTLSPQVKSALATNRHGFVYQVVSKARPVANVARGIDLMTLPVTVNATLPAASSLKASIGKHLSARTRTRLRKIAEKIGLRV